MDDDCPDFDDLIADAIADDDDDFDYEESLLREVEAPAASAGTAARPGPGADGGGPPSPAAGGHISDDDDDSDSFDPDASTVRELFAQARDNSGTDPFAFERYNAATAWRSQRARSPEGMRATAWKSQARGLAGGPVLDLQAALGGLAEPPAPRAPAADVHLMELARRTAPRGTIPLRSLRRRYGGPVPGATCVPMTLGEGLRVYFPVVADGAGPTPARGHTTSSVLGVSMETLIRRVNETRRKKEHERRPTTKRDPEQLRAVSEEEEPDDDETGTAQNCAPTSTADTKLWVDKHAPTTFAHLLSDEQTNREVLRALREWDPYVFHREPPPRPQMRYNQAESSNPQTNATDMNGKRSEKIKDLRPDESSRVILLSGPSGVGKTTLAHIIARHAGYRPIEINGSDERSADVLKERLVRAMESSTLDFSQREDHDGNSRPNCIIMDEIDGADAKGALKALVDIIRAKIPAKGAKQVTFLRRPIIFICNNKWAPSLRPLLPFAKQFDVSPPTSSRLVSRLQAVLKVEGLNVRGGSSMLNNLVMLSGGDIRSCLYTLQFAAYRARELNATRQRLSEEAQDIAGLQVSVDISESLSVSLGGTGMKDARSDVAGTISMIFRKQKDNASKAKGSSSSTDRVLRSMATFGDNSRVLDSLFLNVARVSYIDPAFDRCALAHEWLSVCDIYRSQKMASNVGAMASMQEHHIPTAAAAIHLLCRVEQRSDLVITVRELYDSQFKLEGNQSLVHRFAEGITPQSRCSRSVAVLVSECIPYSLAILSSGHGTGSLDRAIASVDLLNKNELSSFMRHAAVLHALGLTYVAVEDATADGPNKSYRQQLASARLDPPVDRIFDFTTWDRSKGVHRRAIPPCLKLLLARKAAEVRYLLAEVTNASLTQTTRGSSDDKPPVSLSVSAKRGPDEGGTEAPGLYPTKKPKSSPNSVVLTSRNFLQVGARKAMEAKSARNAARVGYNRSKANKESHTGSGIPLSQVVRLKFVKGYTEAVRTPCYLKDLA